MVVPSVVKTSFLLGTKPSALVLSNKKSSTQDAFCCEHFVQVTHSDLREPADMFAQSVHNQQMFSDMQQMTRSRFVKSSSTDDRNSDFNVQSSESKSVKISCVNSESQASQQAIAPFNKWIDSQHLFVNEEERIFPMPPVDRLIVKLITPWDFELSTDISGIELHESTDIAIRLLGVSHDSLENFAPHTLHFFH